MAMKIRFGLIITADKAGRLEVVNEKRIGKKD